MCHLQTARGASLTDVEPSGDSHTTTNGSAAPAPRRLVLLLTVALAAIAADFATKQIALQALQPGQSVEVLGSLLQFTLVFNTGAAFSLGTGFPWVFTIIAFGVVGFILYLGLRVRSTAWALTLGLMMGGAAGNLVDRIFRDPAPFHGAVVDWIRVPNWPVFNIADSCVVVGACLVVLLTFRGINLDGTRESGKGADADEREETG